MDVGATSLRETEELLVPQNLWEQTNKGEALFEEHDISSGCSRLQGTTKEQPLRGAAGSPARRDE